MKLTKIEKVRCRIDSPWTTKGVTWYESETNNFQFEDYPEMFEQIYAFEDGREVVLNDLVYRIKTKGYSRIVASVQLQQCHISGEVEVFPNIECAQEALALENELAEQSNVRSVLRDIETLSSTVNFDTLSLKGIKDKLECINKLSHEAIIR